MKLKDILAKIAPILDRPILDFLRSSGERQRMEKSILASRKQGKSFCGCHFCLSRGKKFSTIVGCQTVTAQRITIVYFY
jgi:hypothetical protein